MARLHTNQSANKTSEGRDVIVEAPFTTGKTQALCIAALQALDGGIKTCQALIVTPTFSGARKILEFTTSISQFMQVERPAAFGWRDAEEDIRALRDGQQFVVGTPRCVLKLIQGGQWPIQPNLSAQIGLVNYVRSPRIGWIARVSEVG